MVRKDSLFDFDRDCLENDRIRVYDMTKDWISKDARLPLEVVILLVAGTMMLITGTLLFPVWTGALPYYANGLYGLLLVIFTLQIMMLGKTPFSDIPRSRGLIAVGVVIAAIGIVTCFVPGAFDRLPRTLLFICFCPGGLLLLLQMCFAKSKLRTWVKYGGVFRHLTFACSVVYILSMLMGLLIWKENLFATPMAAAVALVYGIAIIYLAGVLRNIYAAYPEAEKPPKGSLEISADQVMILMMGIFMLLLGALLIPVNLGLLPFSGSAQLGLLMVIFAVQMLASGSTPVGPFTRSWLMVFFGLLFAAIGTISCIIPEILVSQLTALIGVLNIIGGIVTLGKICIPRLRKTEAAHSIRSPVLGRLFGAQLTMSLLTILFGASMLVAGLIPGLIIGVILAASGCVLLYLLHILIDLDKIQNNAGSSPGSAVSQERPGIA